jgi:type IV pilus assembly protein PilB
LWFDEKLARLVAQGAGEDKIEAAAGDNLQFMWEDGCQKVLNGMTTLSELQAVAVHKTHAMIGAE